MNSHSSVFWPQYIFQLPGRSSAVIWSCPCTPPSAPSVTREEILIWDPVKLMDRARSSQEKWVSNATRTLCTRVLHKQEDKHPDEHHLGAEEGVCLSAGTKPILLCGRLVKQSRDGAGRASEKNKVLSWFCIQLKEEMRVPSLHPACMSAAGRLPCIQVLCSLAGCGLNLGSHSAAHG